MNKFLTKKQLREIEFHNAWADSIDINKLLVIESFETPTAVENRYAFESMGDIRGKTLLDLGCGAGETAVYFAAKGALVTASDISPKMVATAKKLAEKFNVPINTIVSPAENLPMKDNFFDFVFCNGVLHHIDFPAAIKEIKRILKPGGKGFFIEPLPYNPAINIYRHLAGEVRTPDEKPFRFSQLNFLKKTFSQVSHKEFWLLSLIIFVIFYLKGSSPSKERYWKKIIKEGNQYKTIFNILNKIDNILLKIPLLKYLCWNTVITIQK